MRSWLVIAVVAFPTLMDAAWSQEGTRPADGFTLALAGAGVIALVWRRRWPVAVTLLCGLALSALYLMDHTGELLNLPTMVGLYTIAVEGDRRRSVIAGVVAASWSGALAEIGGVAVGSPMLEMLWPIVPLALGEAVRARHELQAEYTARAAQAEADRAREARRLVDDERVGIAREFHDVVAHTMAAVNVQMGVAVAAFDARPETARQALLQARASAKDALQELRATVAVLRDGDGEHPVTPAPSLAQLDDLADAARTAGVEVTVTGAARGEGLSGAHQLAAYRIVQEALTNVIRHSGARTACVTWCVDDDGLVVEVVDDGSGGHTPPGRPGHGLLGMTERVAVFGGRLEHGSLDAGGYRVRATLPTGAGGP